MAELYRSSRTARTGSARPPISAGVRKISKQSVGLFTRRTRYGGLLADGIRRLKALEDENGRLKKVVTDLTLNQEML